MASALPFTIASVTVQWNLFQLFQPMGGVRASPLLSAPARSGRGARIDREIAPSPRPSSTRVRRVISLLLSGGSRMVVEDDRRWAGDRPPRPGNRSRQARGPTPSANEFAYG